MDTLTIQQVLDAKLDDWRKLAQGLHAHFDTGDFATGLDLVNAIGAAAEEANHHPDVTLTYPSVDIKLISHDAGGLTHRDIDMARTISKLAADRGVKADPAVPQAFELALDTADKAKVAPFWAALLTGDASNVDGDDIVDPSGQVPLFWLQDREPGDTPPQRFHIDLWVPHDVADQRIKAALDAGGTLVTDDPAPAFTVLADPEGNKACICTAIR